MKTILQKLLNKLGWRLIREAYFQKLININIVSDLDFFHVLTRYKSIASFRTVFDVGANIGQTSLKFARYFPCADIYAFEPVTSTYLDLQKNCTNIHHIHTYNLGLGEKNEHQFISLQANSEWNSLKNASNSISEKTEEIKIIPLDQFVDDNEISYIDFLKTDTEGFEKEVFYGAHNTLLNKKIGFVYVEVGFLKDDFQHVLFLEIYPLLDKYGYRFAGLFEVVYRSDMQVQYANALFVNEKDK